MLTAQTDMLYHSGLLKVATGISFKSRTMGNKTGYIPLVFSG